MQCLKHYYTSISENKFCPFGGIFYSSTSRLAALYLQIILELIFENALWRPLHGSTSALLFQIVYESFQTSPEFSSHWSSPRDRYEFLKLSNSPLYCIRKQKWTWLETEPSQSETESNLEFGGASANIGTLASLTLYYSMSFCG